MKINRNSDILVLVSYDENAGNFTFYIKWLTIEFNPERVNSTFEAVARTMEN